VSNTFLKEAVCRCTRLAARTIGRLRARISPSFLALRAVAFVSCIPTPALGAIAKPREWVESLAAGCGEAFGMFLERVSGLITLHIYRRQLPAKVMQNVGPTYLENTSSLHEIREIRQKASDGVEASGCNLSVSARGRR
jgi:hypothetical protein